MPIDTHSASNALTSSSDAVSGDAGAPSGDEARFSFDRKEASAPVEPTGRKADQSPGRRRHGRHRVELSITFGSEHNFYAGFVENLSAGGIFVATHQIRSVGETFELAIELPGREQPVTGIGEVRWVREIVDEDAGVSPGMGIRFLVLDEGTAEAIDAFVERRDPLFFDDEVLS